jgi:ribonuclease P/MRP protein subunit RPP1
VLSSYDVLAVQPESERALQAACSTLDIDIISIDLATRLPFALKPGLIRQATSRGVAFELRYSPIVSDAASRKACIGNVAALLRFGLSPNRIMRGALVVSSDADTPWKSRAPPDVLNLLGIMGVPSHVRLPCLTSAPERVIMHAASRKLTFRGAVFAPSLGVGCGPAASRNGPVPITNSGAGENQDTTDLLQDFIRLK